MSVQSARTRLGEGGVEQSGRSAQVQVDARLLWQAVLADLQQAIPATASEWLRHTRLTGFDADVATVAASDRVTTERLSQRFGREIERALSDRVGRPVTAVFLPDGIASNSFLEQRSSARAASTDRRANGDGGREMPQRRVEPAERPRQLELAPSRAHGLNARYVFRTYVVGSANRFAHAASISVAEHPGGKFNPLFIHGGVGLGKTHLLHAVGHRALDLHPDLRVAYVTSEKFTNDLIGAIRSQRTEEFRLRYRETDILMIDDIQFIAGKESTQEEFFHTFNALYQSGKQVIMSSDKPPKAISGLEERLCSRFEGGLMADVQLPDFEMRMAILRQKGEELDGDLPSEVIEYIAHKDQSNIRELEGALNKVIARAQLTGDFVSVPLAMEALAVAPLARGAAPTRDQVIMAVLEHFSIGRRELCGRTRTKEVVLPRQVAMYLLREETGASLVDIGAELGGREHTTVLHGIRQVERSLASDAGLRGRLLAIREAILSGAPA
jgi:chromosomal replication initiator protein